jgi:hypothetical protein
MKTLITAAIALSLMALTLTVHADPQDDLMRAQAQLLRAQSMATYMNIGRPQVIIQPYQYQQPYNNGMNNVMQGYGMAHSINQDINARRQANQNRYNDDE